MQMPQAVERRRHHEQMHQVIVIGDEIVETPARDPARIVERDLEMFAGELHFRAADARRSVAPNGRHRQMLARRHQLADALGEVRFGRLELSP